MQAHDWSRFLLRIPLSARKEAVYNAWTSQKGLESWFLRKASFKKRDGSPRPADAFIETDDSYEWLWHGWPDDTIEKGMVLEANGTDLLRFTFGQAGNVKVTIVEEKGTMLLELMQDQIPTDEFSQVNFHLGCTKGWLFYLTNLKSVLEGGLDLRNRNMALKNVITC